MLPRGNHYNEGNQLACERRRERLGTLGPVTAINDFTSGKLATLEGASCGILSESLRRELSLCSGEVFGDAGMRTIEAQSGRKGASFVRTQRVGTLVRLVGAPGHLL